jgi:predicted peptidase
MSLIVRLKLAKFLLMLGICILVATLLFGAESYARETYTQNTSAVHSTTKHSPSHKKKKVSSTSHVALRSFASPAPTPTPYVNKGFLAEQYTSPQGVSMTYYLNIPNGYVPTKKYPLVLLLPGSGERAIPGGTPEQDRNILFIQPYVQVWGPTYNATDSPHIQQHWPCFVVIPQLPPMQQFVDVPAQTGSYTMAPQPNPWLLTTKEIVDSLQQQYVGIDASRLYITGISLGAYGVWEAIERWPDYFAAAAPIAGAGDPSKASVLKNMPVWAFHGSADLNVPVSGSRDMIAAIKASGGHPLYTEFPNAPHAVWNMVYSTTGNSNRVVGFFPWLFSQRRVIPETPQSHNIP